MDFGCLVIHLFLEELREFYSLERLWSDAESIDIGEWITE
ncbi:MAG: RsfS/YbeB/iojap family protein [Oscillospiraceae bacterium]|nr:RsfS/YbeB/iojap family protein [Oscillospiraceae bacterium]